MFSTEFIRDTKMRLSSHNAVYFNTTQPNSVVLKKLQTMKIAGFVLPDVKPVSVYVAGTFSDQRMTGNAMYASNQGCCSFTKNCGLWYLFPFHKNELNSLGLTEDHLIYWVKYLNQLKVGFKYLYLDEQPTTADHWAHMTMHSMVGNGKRIPDNMFYWVAVPRMPSKTNMHPYLHWVMLRMLINSVESNRIAGDAAKVPYYWFPRMVDKLMSEFAIPNFKALMYANAMMPWYDYYGLSKTDNYELPGWHPNPSITAGEFKKLLGTVPPSFALNSFLCSINDPSAIKVIGRSLTAKHNQAELHKLTMGGKFKEAIAYLDNIYFPKTKKPKKVSNVKKKKQLAAD